MSSYSKEFGKDLALTPPMGWNSFNTFGCEPTEQLIKESADMMVSSGLRDAGYVYINIDDGWMADERDSEGNLVPDPAKFPNGLKVVTDYIHERGLKAGTYLGCGQKTYGEKPGSLGYEERDAKLIADQGFDLLKYDFRALPGDPEGRHVKTDYITMRDALIKAGRTMLFSICEHGTSDPWTWGAEVGHMWRTTPDIKDSFDEDINWGWSLNHIIDHTHHLHQYAGPGGWNDPDMLVVGCNGTTEWMGPGCTPLEYRAHFSIWCLSAAPLLIGCDIRKMDDATKETLMNKEIISINQDSLGKQGYIIKKENGVDYWVKELEGGQFAVGLFNRTESAVEAEVDLHELPVSQTDTFSVKDIWGNVDLGNVHNTLIRSVRSHECVVLKLTPRK
ncbi:glycoside hydrolase family 27 protein [Alkalihalobacterium bogoriense]|uniref:glycoside hydrolase family 27 protein n=1 Tax=Alkalihalobacterium bogoriense TaxID=246272 RepID=UPI000A01E9BA|nr:glycoside hydrolase family 27 protein [Alkalihalobacterium bogoriense]